MSQTKNYKVKKKSKYKLFQEQINKYSKHINIPKNNLFNQTNINMHTNLSTNITYFKDKIIKKSFNLKSDMLKNEPIKTKKYELLPTDKQKIVLQKWFNAYIDMYNLVIKKIKNEIKNEVKMKFETNKKFKLIDLNIDLSIQKLKKEFAKNKEKLRDKYSINMHILDYAINDAIIMHKSKMSNLKNGYIKTFRLRYLKRTKNQKIIKIENHLCSEHTFCPKSLGLHMSSYTPINYKEEIKIVGIIQYNKKTDEYNLLVRKRIINEHPDDFHTYTKELNFYDQIQSTTNKYLEFMKKIKQTNVCNDNIRNLNKRFDLNKRKLNSDRIYKNEISYRNKKSLNKNIISIDPGIRTFLTGISNNHTIEIGTNLKNKIKQKIKYVDKLTNNILLTDQKKEMLLQKTRDKLKNKVNDYHWKSINYLVSNYKHILIGNFSTKQMGESNTNKIIKCIGNNIRMYVFKQRLQYKCYLHGIKYAEIDEYCTSKCCSGCNYYKKDLGSSKIYNCNRCKLVIDRDLNAAKNILMKGIK